MKIKKRKNQRFLRKVRKIISSTNITPYISNDRLNIWYVSHTIDACQNYRTKNFPTHSHHDHAIEPKGRITLERITLANENLFRLRVTPIYVSPRLSSPLFPPCYTRELTRARGPGRHATRTHARTHALDWIILEHEPRAMISMNTRCARAARENEMSSAGGKPWKKVVRSHGSLAGVVGAAPRE